MRSVLVQRKLVESREEKARIDACGDPTTLRRWLSQAVVAPSVTEALRVDAAEVEAKPRRRRNKGPP